MFRFVLFALFYVVALCLNGGEEKPPEVPEGFVIEQAANGFPGTNLKNDTKQRVYISGNKLFMENLESPNICIVRGDLKKTWEIDVQKKTYTERHFDYFTKLLKEKLANRKVAVAQLNALPNAVQRAKMAKSLGYIIGRDGKVSANIVANSVLTGEEKEINGFKCYRLQIFEDARIVLDLWLTKDLKAPKSLLDFYKKLGCFADEVVTEMEKIEDFPVLLNASLAFGSVDHEVTCEISKVEKKAIPEEKFELPKGLILAKVVTGKGVKHPLKTVCPVCGKKIDPDATGKNKPIRYVHENVAYLFDSRECLTKFIKLLAKFNGDDKKVLRELAKERAKKQKK